MLQNTAVAIDKIFRIVLIQFNQNQNIDSEEVLLIFFVSLMQKSVQSKSLLSKMAGMVSILIRYRQYWI